MHDLTDGAELWEGFEGMDAQQIFNAQGVGHEIRMLQLVGVSNAHDLVLRFGPKRCKQVRVWAEKKRRNQGVKNMGGMIAGTIIKGPPRRG